MKSLNPSRAAAVALYLFAVGLLVFVLWPDESAHAREFWDSLHQSAASNLFQQAGSAAPPPFAFQFGYVAMWALCYTVAGLLFIWVKHRFSHYLEQWRIRAGALTIDRLAEQQTSLMNIIESRGAIVANLEANFADNVRLLFRRAQVRVFAQAEKERDTLRAKSVQLIASRATKEAARAEADEINAWLISSAPPVDDNKATPINQGRKAATVMALLVVAGGAVLMALPAHAETSAQLCAAAPDFEVLADVSGSSPLRDAAYIQAVAALLEEKIRALPTCADVRITTIGDAARYPLTFHKKIFLRAAPGGITKDELCRGLRQLLATMPKRIADDPHGKSELIGAFADAARNINPQAKTPNQIIALSDGIENGPLSNCDRNPHCRFPGPQFKLSNTTVSLLGCGLGLNSNRAAWLTQQWNLFFAAAGVKAYLPRTF